MSPVLIGYPTGWTLAVVDRVEDAERTANAVREAGCPDRDVLVIAGGDAPEQLRRLGASRGLLARARRAVQFIAMGESSGRLAEMCGRAADVLDRETDRRISTGIRMLEPLLVVMCGGLITLIAATLLRAVYSLRPA